MRKSYDTLAGLTTSVLNENPLSGALFVFLIRPRNRIKILYYAEGGYCLWMKRLEAGAFPLPPGSGDKQQINAGNLAMLFDGLKIVMPLCFFEGKLLRILLSNVIEKAHNHFSNNSAPDNGAYCVMLCMTNALRLVSPAATNAPALDPVRVRRGSIILLRRFFFF